ncbi:MAG: DUF3179 domain-containing protein [Nitrososphaerales archaeon]
MARNRMDFNGLSWNVKRALRRGIIAGAATLFVYLLVVIVTTPNLPPASALNAAFEINSIIIIGIAIGVGTQIFLSTYSKGLGCRLNVKHKALGGNSGSTATASFFSFFSLVPLGCCGWWLYALSLLPSFVGTGASAFLIQFSQPLAYLGLAVIFGFNGLTAYKLLQEKRQKQKVTQDSGTEPPVTPKTGRRFGRKAVISAILAGVIIVTLTSYSLASMNSIQGANISPGTSVTHEVIVSNGVRHTVPLDKLVSGGPPKDGIPSIDNPKFIPAGEAKLVGLKDDDLVAGLNINGDAKAYPFKILVWHEIVNDRVGGVPVAVTECPLCSSTVAFVRVVDGNEVEFGVSGKLYNSDLVMYDRPSETYWSQLIGEGIVGKYAGYTLDRVPLDVMSWSDWKALYPNTKVLSTKTGFQRPYGIDPYSSYYASPTISFPVDHLDPRLGPKEVVFGVALNTTQKAYPIKYVIDLKIINDNVGGKNLVIFAPKQSMLRMFAANVNGQVLEFEYKDSKIFDKQTGSEWNFDGKAISGKLQGTTLERISEAHLSFWFAWAAFYHNSQLFVV